MSRVVLCVQNLGVPDDPRVWREATSLASEGHHVTVVAPGTPSDARHERIDGVEVVRYRVTTGDGVLGQLAEVVSGFVGTTVSVARLRWRRPIDVLHVANPPDTLFPLGWWLRRRGTLFVYDQHDVAPELAAAKLGRHVVLDRLLRWLERASYRTADLVIACNNASRRRAIAEGVPPARVVTVRLGPTDADAPSDPPSVPTVAYAGVMGSQDGVEVLVDAFAAVARRHAGRARLLLIGRGDAVPELHRRIDRHGIADAVTWTGWLPRAEVHEQLRRATVGVSPDVDDPYTRLCTMVKVSEYLAAGLPAVVADLPENRVTAGGAASYFRPGDADDLAARLEAVLFDVACRRELAEAAARRAPALLWERSAPRLLAAYEHLLDGTAAIEGDQHVDDELVARQEADDTTMDHATIPFMNLPRLHATIRAELDAAYDRVMHSGSFIEGPELVAFEQAFAAAHGVPGAAGVGSGTDALALALRALGIGHGDEVIVPSMTFIATAEAVIHAGATPVIADVDAETLLLTPETVEPVLTARTRAIVPVHLFGHLVAPTHIAAWIDLGLLVLEDAAQAHLGHHEGVRVGHMGHAAAFSFYPGKNLGAMGDGGAVISRNPALPVEIHRLRNHGCVTKYEHQVVGWNSRLDGLQAALLAVKLAHLPVWTDARRRIADHYGRRFAADGVRTVPWQEGDVHHLLVIRLPGGARDGARDALAARGIQVGIHYPIPLSEQPSLAPYQQSCPNAELAGRELLSLPMDPLMTSAEVERVCDEVAALVTA